MSTDFKFTPTESLIIDVLVARFRLGTTLWTFDSHVKPTLRRLEEKGLVFTASPITPNTIRAGLTQHALSEYGHQWFQLGITTDMLPHQNRGHWAKSVFEDFVDLTQQPNSILDPKAVNAAHLLMTQMIARHHPVYRADHRISASVLLRHAPSNSAVEIFALGPTYHLTRDKEATVTTTRRDEALYFTFCTPQP